MKVLKIIQRIMIVVCLGTYILLFSHYGIFINIWDYAFYHECEGKLMDASVDLIFDKFCENCGEELTEESNIQVKTFKDYCKSCSTKLDISTDYCTKCGTKCDRSGYNLSETPIKNKLGYIFLNTVLFVNALVTLLVGVSFITTNSSIEESDDENIEFVEDVME